MSKWRRREIQEPAQGHRVKSRWGWDETRWCDRPHIGQGVGTEIGTTLGESRSHITPSAGWASGWALHRRSRHTPRLFISAKRTRLPHTRPPAGKHSRSNTSTYWSRRVRSKPILRAAGLRSAAGGRVPPHSRPPGNYGNGGEPAPRRKGGACESRRGAHPRSEPLRPLLSPPGLGHSTPSQDPIPQLQGAQLPSRSIDAP